MSDFTFVDFTLIIIINYFSAQAVAPKGEMKSNYGTDCIAPGRTLEFLTQLVWQSCGNPIGILLESYGDPMEIL